MKKIDKNAVSLAGEFAVLSRLALEGYDANMTLGHTKGVDILISKPGTNEMYRLEVKTKLRKSNRQAKRSNIFGTFIGDWMMSRKHEAIKDPSLFYCFVTIWEGTKESRFFIVPSCVVADYVKAEHRLWRAAKKKEGNKVRPNDMRMLRIGFRGNKYAIDTPYAEKYENNWNFSR